MAAKVTDSIPENLDPCIITSGRVEKVDFASFPSIHAPICNNGTAAQLKTSASVEAERGITTDCSIGGATIGREHGVAKDGPVKEETGRLVEAVSDRIAIDGKRRVPDKAINLDRCIGISHKS